MHLTPLSKLLSHSVVDAYRKIPSSDENVWELVESVNKHKSDYCPEYKIEAVIGVMSSKIKLLRGNTEIICDEYPTVVNFLQCLRRRLCDVPIGKMFIR